MHARDITDLRTALSFLNTRGREVDVEESELDPVLGIASHFARHGAGAPSRYPANSGRPVIYSRVKGSSVPVLMGLFSSRRTCAELLGLEYSTLGKDLSGYVTGEFPPEAVSNPPCQQNVVTSDIDIARLLPVPTYTKNNAGPYITLGLVYARDPETGDEDVTIHRLCVQGKDTLTIYLIPGRHIELFYRKAKKMNKPLPITINIGLDPAIYLVSTFSYPVCPEGFNELNAAGALRKRGVEVARAVTNDTRCIAHAEFVLEGVILPEEMPENREEPEGNSLPEFLGYTGRAQKSLPVVKITAITHRDRPIYQTISGPGAELSNLCGISTEASLYKCIRESVTDKIINCHCSHSGGGKLLAFLQFRKESPMDDAKTRQAGIAAFAAFHELKHVFLLDNDVDILDEREVLWAMTTRFQGSHSTISIPNLNGHPLDPSQSPEFAMQNSMEGTTFKTVFDCTVPFKMKEKFRRANYEL